MYPNASNSPYGGMARGYAYAGQLDVGAVMRQVYVWLAVGLAVGFGVAFLLGQAATAALTTGQGAAAVNLIYSPVVSIIALVLYLVLGFAFYPIVRRVSPAVGAVLYLVFAAVFGFLISSVFIVYSGATISAAFAATAGMFGVLSVIGYTTRVDLSKLGMLLFMALIGLIIASVVNLFLNNSALYWIVSYAGVVIFSGLVAYDTQWIKRQAVSVTYSGDGNGVARLALIGAFKLFLDFVNLFLFLLRILGGRGGRQ